MQLFRQIWVLMQKDFLIIVRRNWSITLLRALILPIIITFVLSYVKVWTGDGGHYGVGVPSPVRSLSDAFAVADSSRKKFVIIDSNLTGNDVQAVINELASTARTAKKELHLAHDASTLNTLCPSSSGGITNCFGAVQFWSSPNQSPGAIWNYTIYQDGAFGSSIDVTSTRNDAQVYSLPLQQAVDRAISRTSHGPGLPQTIWQFPYSTYTQAAKEADNAEQYQQLVSSILAFTFFIGMCGITYHLTGYVTQHREEGMLQLIDAMMPNRRRWECLVARIASMHFAFDLIYAPAWVVMGVVMGAIAFPNTNIGWLVLLHLLCGLALSSFSILASSLFRRSQLSAISTVVTAVVLAIVAQFAENGVLTATATGVYATGILFPPCTFVYFLIVTSSFELDGKGLAINVYPTRSYWSIPASTFLGFFVFQIIAYPVMAMFIEKYLHGTASANRSFRPASEMDGCAVRLSGFSKHYNRAAKKRDRVQAVTDLSLNLHAGLITVLLGANGSGKSTTLNAIAGVETITSGRIEVDAAGGIGLCPQKNVMWDSLTVEEHVLFFERLKNPSATRAQSLQEVGRLVTGCDLEIKSKAQAKTLSGGQKRKLQLAMMLAGGSLVCCIDEASSGIDPIARRKIWDILLKERGRRTLLLTTHFLDESEVLSDHVAILSKGRLRAEGSVASLKNTLGGGYQIVTSDQINSLTLESLPPSITRRSDYNHVVFDIPDAGTLTPFLTSLDQHGITEYRIRGPTIENIFLRLADEMQQTKIESLTALKLNVGKGCGPFKQIGVLLLKRVTILKHNFMPYVTAMFLTLVVAGIVTRLLIDPEYPNGLPCVSNDVRQDYVVKPSSLSPALVSSELVFGNSQITVARLQSLIPNGTFYSAGPDQYTDWSMTQTVDSYDEFEKDLATPDTYNDGGFFISQSNATFAYLTPNGVDTALIVQGVLHMALMNTSIAFSQQSFSAPFSPLYSTEALIAVFTALGFAIYPGLFALYPTAERLRNVRAMQYSNGIRSSSLWIAYALFDMIFILLASVLATVIWSTQYHGWYGLGYMFVCFFLYGLASTAYSYIVSLFVSSQLAAMALTSLVQVVIAMLFFVGYVVTVQNAPATEIYTWFNYIYYTMALICPAVSLFRALLMVLNVYSLVCRGTSRASYPGAISIYGAPILYLTLQFVLFVAFLMFWESGRSLEIFGIRSTPDPDKQKKQDKEVEAAAFASHPDAAEDPGRLSSSNAGLRVHNMSRSFGSNLAVDNVTFGVLPSEKFALLGPNGAGKSTMISLIRGDLRADSTHPPGNVFIANDSLTHAPLAAKRHLGVCPQFDAVDSMTLSEHLHFYARARGVPDKEANIAELTTRLGLTEHANKLVKKLSGGTKRKLSLAIALISNPSVLLLDEPSSGMDPAAKRALWSTLSSIAAGRSLLITTHSMEEADALCDRAGIMARSMLALGTIQELHARHGQNIHIHLVHKDAPNTSAQDTEKLWQWVLDTFPVADVEQRTFGGQIRFAVPIHGTSDAGTADGSRMGQMFRLIEEHKAELGIRDYSIGPATLDQVFLNVVGKHDVVEETTEKPKRGWRTLIGRGVVRST